MGQKIAWFTEGGWSGKIPRNNPGMRNDSAWMCVLDATHYPIWEVHNITEKYDLGIVTLPKKNIDKLSQYPLIESLRKCCKKIAYMQEGPHWYFQDYPLDQQIWFFNTLQEMDLLYVHNESDIQYFKGLTGKECKLMPTLMIEDLIKDLPQVERKNIMMGGNFCSWYGGFDSYMVAQEADCPIYVPTMGRKIEGEEHMPNLNHLPYMDWLNWIKELNKFKYGIHLMRTQAAGTFALNCAYLGIPCIGYEGLDTQEKCHPKLTVQLGDLASAKELLTLLTQDKDFYQECVVDTKLGYTHYTENQFLDKMNHILIK
tara:strand:+ start:815 stop:1756 length:942 start_codon:yes stop_codon:yes gene_type:complete